MDQTEGQGEVTEEAEEEEGRMTEPTEGAERSVTQRAEETDVLRAANPDDATTSSPSYVYAIGRVEPRFPSLAVEKEFAQATGRSDTAGLTDRVWTLRDVLLYRVPPWPQPQVL